MPSLFVAQVDLVVFQSFGFCERLFITAGEAHGLVNQLFISSLDLNELLQPKLKGLEDKGRSPSSPKPEHGTSANTIRNNFALSRRQELDSIDIGPRSTVTVDNVAVSIGMMKEHGMYSTAHGIV